MKFLSANFPKLHDVDLSCHMIQTLVLPSRRASSHRIAERVVLAEPNCVKRGQNYMLVPPEISSHVETSISAEG
jgi:hypothetical protein